MIIAIAEALTIDEAGNIKRRDTPPLRTGVHFQQDSETENEFITRIMEKYNNLSVGVVFYRAEQMPLRVERSFVIIEKWSIINDG